LVLSVIMMGTMALAGNINGGLGVINTDKGTATNLMIRGNWKIAPWGLGLDINWVMPEASRPSNLDLFVLRYVEYDDGTRGVRLGTIENLTYGYGLLMDNYSTFSGATTIVTNQQLGVRAYTKDFPVWVDVLGTRSSVYGVRLVENWFPELILGRPLLIGQTFITDSDGVLVSGNIVGKGQTAIGVDAGIPIVPGVWDVFAEYGMLPDAGHGLKNVSGWTVGTKVGVFDIAKVSFQFLNYQSGFVPGYFNAQYETSPVALNSSANINSAGKSGYLGRLEAALTDQFTLSGTYQKFEGFDPSLAATAGAKLPNDIQATATYEQPKFASLSDLDQNNATYKLDVFYPVQGGKMVVHWKRVAIAASTYQETTWAEYMLDFGNLF